MPRPSVTGMTQIERREATRARLLDAAIDTIYELGYAGASTTEIARRAGVSRGAQVHHFPSKAELVTAAMEHSMERRLEEYERLLERVPPGRGRLAASIDLLWEEYQSKDCEVWIEIAVAARSDPELRPHVTAVSERHREAVDDMVRRLLPPAPGQEDSLFYTSACKFIVALLDGLVLQRMLGYDDGPGRADQVVEAAKALAAMALPVDPNGG